MGRAARVKQQLRAAGAQTSAGNPAPFEPMVTVMAADKFREALKAGKSLRAKFSDREYVMDKNGTLRRVHPMPSATLAYGPRPVAREGEA